jgi:hypothetical protein
MEPGRHFDQRADAARHLAAAAVRLQNPCQQLENGGLAGAVMADDAHRLAGPDLEGHVLDGPELVLLLRNRSATYDPRRQSREEVPQAVVVLASPEFLRDGVENDRTAGAHLRCSPQI